MSSFSQKIIPVLKHLNNHDQSRLSEREWSLQKQEAYSAFSAASVELPAILIDDAYMDDAWLWSTEKSEYEASDHIGAFRIKRTTSMEAAIGAHEKLRQFVAMAPDLELVVDLLGAYHHPGGGGLQQDAFIKVSIDFNDNTALRLAMDGMAMFAPEIVPLINSGVKVQVNAYEGTESSVVNPPDLVAAFSKVVTEARENAYADDPDCSGHNDPMLLVERISLGLEISANVDFSTINETLIVMGNVFTGLSLAMDNFYPGSD